MILEVPENAIVHRAMPIRGGGSSVKVQGQQFDLPVKGGGTIIGHFDLSTGGVDRRHTVWRVEHEPEWGLHVVFRPAMGKITHDTFRRVKGTDRIVLAEPRRIPPKPRIRGL